MPRVTTKRPDGEAIRALRKRQGLTVAQLAARLPGCRHPQSVRKLEVAKSVLASEVFLYQIANALGVDIDEITTADDEEDEATSGAKRTLHSITDTLRTERNMEGKTQHELDLAGTDGGMHARLAQGLIDAAHYILAHRELPVPFTVDVHYCIPAATDKDGEDEAYRIAGMLGATVTGSDFSSETQRGFGPAVAYRAVYVNRDQMTAYREHMAAYNAEQAVKRLGELRAAVAESNDEARVAVAAERSAAA